MTAEDQLLDHSCITKESPLTLYRLASRKYATSLSGLGAAMYPGRWNLTGEEAIYTSTQIAVCVLERLVHTPKDRIPADLALMTIHPSGTWRVSGRLATDRMTGAAWILRPALRDDRADDILRNMSKMPIALAVPSVIVPVWNVVLYPRAKGFWDHVSLLSVEPFDYDPRLFPDQTPVQP